MANYSYDYGDAHFTCLDSNTYIDPTDPALVAWIEADLKSAAGPRRGGSSFFIIRRSTSARSTTPSSICAPCRPLFERHGRRDGSERSRAHLPADPSLRFAPTDLTAAKTVNSSKRLVPGTFTIDREFDGATKNQPKGIIYFTSGAGGRNLYDPDAERKPRSAGCTPRTATPITSPASTPTATP